MLQRLKNLFQKLFYSPEESARRKGVKIGKNCSIATRFFGSEPYLVELGDHVQVTNDVRFFTHGGGWVFRQKYPDMDVFGKIKIGNNVYVGNCALLLPDVTIGDNVIIAAGAVVTKSVESGSIVGGNPAKKIGNIQELEQKYAQLNLKTKHLSYLYKKNFLLNADFSQFIRK